MYKAIKTFAGNKVSMKKGDTIEKLDKELAEDYIRAGFIEEIKPAEAKKEVVKEVEPPVKKSTSKKKK